MGLGYDKVVVGTTTTVARSGANTTAQTALSHSVDTHFKSILNLIATSLIFYIEKVLLNGKRDTKG